MLTDVNIPRMGVVTGHISRPESKTASRGYLPVHVAQLLDGASNRNILHFSSRSHKVAHFSLLLDVCFDNTLTLESTTCRSSETSANSVLLKSFISVAKYSACKITVDDKTMITFENKFTIFTCQFVMDSCEYCRFAVLKIRLHVN